MNGFKTSKRILSYILAAVSSGGGGQTGLILLHYFEQSLTSYTVERNSSNEFEENQPTLLVPRVQKSIMLKYH